MRGVDFSEAVRTGRPMNIIAPDGREIEGRFCDPALNRATMPDGWNAYDISHDSEGIGIFCRMSRAQAAVNSAGTFFTTKEIPELAGEGSSIEFEIEESEWLLGHGIDPYAPDPDAVRAVSPCPEPKADSWGYTFV